MANAFTASTATGSTAVLTAAEARSYLRIDDTSEDTYLNALISAATDYAEKAQCRKLLNTTMTEYYDSWPANNIIEVLYNPLVSVTSLKYYDTSGVQQTLTPTTDYTVDSTSIVGRVYPAYNKYWPSLYDIDKCIELIYVAGYGDANDVPDATKQAIIMLVGHWFENREATSSLSITELPIAVEPLLMLNALIAVR